MQLNGNSCTFCSKFRCAKVAVFRFVSLGVVKLRIRQQGAGRYTARRGSRKPGEAGAFVQLGNAQFDRPGSGLPNPVTVAVALGQMLRILLPRKPPGPGFQLLVPGRAAKPIISRNRSVSGVFHERAQVHHIVGHRLFLGCVYVQQPDLTGESARARRL